jgi:nicotinamide-nucleotide amidase
MRAEIISIGTELLLGEIDDTNATYIARRLRDVGINLYFRTTVGDNEARIAQAVDAALDRADVVITTGGLGPTVDDVTREGIARATGRELEFSETLLGQIAARFRRFNVAMSDNNRRQAYIPAGAIPVENPVGTAPIFILETGRGTIMALPGVPREMKHLLDSELLPWLTARMDAPALIKSLTLRTAGVGESQIDARIADLMTAANPTVGLAAHTGQTDVRITARARTGDEADALIDGMERELRERLGTWIYGTGDALLEDAVADLLNDAGATVATLEIGSHGLLNERLENAVGHCSGCYAGGRSYDELSEWLSESGIDAPTSPADLAAAAADYARSALGADYGLAVIMQAGQTPDGSGETQTAIAQSGGARNRVRTFSWLHERVDAHIWATTHALAMLRRALLNERDD